MSTVLPLTQELQGTMESVFQGQTDMSSEKQTNIGSRGQSARGVFRFTNMHLLMLYLLFLVTHYIQQGNLTEGERAVQLTSLY